MTAPYFLPRPTELTDAVDGVPFFAGSVDVKSVSSVRHQWVLVSLEINAGISTISFGEQQTLSLRKRFKRVPVDGAYDPETHTVTLIREGIALYSVNVSHIEELTTAVDKGWNIAVASPSARQMFILASHPDLSESDLPHYLTAAALNPTDGPVCGKTSPTHFNPDSALACGRLAGHLGQHQHITDEAYGDFDMGAASVNPGRLFGMPTRCVHCGYVEAGDGAAIHVCFTCGFWLNQVLNDRDRAFVISGIHYRAGKGGFGGHVFTVRRHTGETYTGELWSQGIIPEHMRDRLPDNAEFVSE